MWEGGKGFGENEKADWGLGILGFAGIFVGLGAFVA